MEVLIDRMRREAARGQDNIGKTTIGIITSYDPANYAVKAILQPDGIETGWMPLGSPMVGNGWGVFLPPSLNDQVIVIFQENGHEVPIATLRLYDDKNRALPAPSGEMWFVHVSGTYLKLTNDGKALLHSASEIDIGNLGNGLHTLATDAILAIFNNHVHTNGNGGSDTGVSTTQFTTADFTSVLKAN